MDAMRRGWIVLAAALLARAAEERPFHEAELIFPLEKWHNHSSAIVEQPNGDLLVCWYHGSGERTADDVIIRGARWSKKERAWSQPFLMADTPGFPDTNPTMYIDSKQRLWLFWAPIIANEWHTALTKYRVSSDYQKQGPPRWEWSEVLLLIPKNIGPKTKQVFGGLAAQHPEAARLIERAHDKYFSRMGWFGRTHPFELPSGRFLVPLYSDGYSFGLMAISDDRGATWYASEPIVCAGCIQPSVLRRKNGELVAYLRDNGPPPKRIHLSVSKDDGLSWTPGVDTDLPNPGASVEGMVLRDGSWVLVYNDTERARNSLVVALSDNEGRTWRWRRHLELDAREKGAGSFHYPSVLQARDGSLHVTYSFFRNDLPQGAPRKTIKHARFNLAWIKQGDAR